ncbi:MAG: DUF2027 domain-containing protein [Muribaculaceae bacterium]|nr:DUF2027 domain-containing protein [Muribaculaceae bacterium]
MAKVGDIVRFLNAVGGGRIVKIDGNIAYVDDDGFETPVLLRECVVVGQAPAYDKAPKLPNVKEQPPVVTASKVEPMVTAEEEELPVEETADGDVLNVVLAFEPSDSRNPSGGTIDTYIVNDSNYFLSFTYMGRSDTDTEWTQLYSGTVEPNIQLFLGEVDKTSLAVMEHIAVQYVAFKRDRAFALKKPALVELSFDTTKFFKLHCFKDSIYFDKPVIALDIVRNDEPNVPKPVPADGKKLEQAMMAKKHIDLQPRRPVRKRSLPTKSHDGMIVVDLHIQELVDNIRGLSNADMLNMQIDEFRRVMDANLKNKGCKIIFIHGKGEGVLRQALMKELNHRYKGHDVQDASFREYGFGATQVTI